jgi:hypothetical protein
MLPPMSLIVRSDGSVRVQGDFSKFGALWQVAERAALPLLVIRAVWGGRDAHRLSGTSALARP